MGEGATHSQQGLPGAGEQGPGSGRFTSSPVPRCSAPHVVCTWPCSHQSAYRDRRQDTPVPPTPSTAITARRHGHHTSGRPLSHFSAALLRPLRSPDPRFGHHSARDSLVALPKSAANGASPCDSAVTNYLADGPILGTRPCLFRTRSSLQLNTSFRSCISGWRLQYVGQHHSLV